jgi:hypothetical protein
MIAAPTEAVMNSQWQYRHALERMNEMHKQAEKERLLKPYRLSWRVRSAKALHSLAQRLESNETISEAIS